MFGTCTMCISSSRLSGQPIWHCTSTISRLVRRIQIDLWVIFFFIVNTAVHLHHLHVAFMAIVRLSDARAHRSFMRANCTNKLNRNHIIMLSSIISNANRTGINQLHLSEESICNRWFAILFHIFYILQGSARPQTKSEKIERTVSHSINEDHCEKKATIYTLTSPTTLWNRTSEMTLPTAYRKLHFAR